MALGVTIPTLPDLGPTDATAEASFGQLGYAVVRRHLGVLLAKESGTRLGEDIEELHDMRVATRRLRAALDLFAEVFPVRAVGLRNELRWLAGVLGAVRDLDVQLERMDDPEWAAGRGRRTAAGPRSTSCAPCSSSSGTRPVATSSTASTPPLRTPGGRADVHGPAPPDPPDPGLPPARRSSPFRYS